jgi:uncharacterized protein (TIGR02246 family)
LALALNRLSSSGKRFGQSRPGAFRPPFLIDGTHPDLVCREADIMRGRKLFGLACGLVAAVAFGLVYGSGAPPAPPVSPTQPTGAKQEPGKAVPGKGKRAQEFLEAFNKGDAKAVAGFYTPTGEYTDMDGHRTQGRDALEKLYSKVFAQNKGAKLTVNVTSARMVGTDVALEEGITEVAPADGGPPSVAAFSAVIVKKDGEWYFESVRETVAQPPSNAGHFEGIDWLLGEWTGEATKGESAWASYSWAENRNFIVSSFFTTLNGIPVVGGTQWIAWDAVDKQIRSWSFYSGGGFGEGVWSQSGDTWTIKTTARSADGKKIAGTNIITRTDNDHATWQITKLTVDGQPVPDPNPVKMVRVKPEQKK